MPDFVQTSASQQLPTPLYMPGIKIKSFLIELSMDVVQRYCDKYFNIGDASQRNFIYRPMPLFPYASLLVLQYPKIIAADRTVRPDDAPPLNERGFLSQQEVFIGMPVMRHGTSISDFLLNVAVEFAYPFMVVDNSTSVVSGREILGFPKLQAKIKQGEGDYPDSFAASVQMLGWPSLDPTVRQQWMPFMDVRTGPPTPYVGPSPDIDSVWSLAASGYVRRGMEMMAAAFDGLDRLTYGLMPSPLRVVALKQFRDAKNPHEAVYQAIIDAKPRYYNVRDLQFYNEQDVEITFHDGGSFDELIRDFLDGPPNSSADKSNFQDIVVEVKMACSFTADIDYTEMYALHTFTNRNRHRRKGLDLATVSPWLRPLVGFWDLR